MVLAWGTTITVKPVVWSLAVYGLYAIAGFEWMRIPFVPLSVMGIAVSF